MRRKAPPVDIGKALEAGDVDTAEMRAHTLNGIAGTLGVEARPRRRRGAGEAVGEKDSAQKNRATHVPALGDVALSVATKAIRCAVRSPKRP